MKQTVTEDQIADLTEKLGKHVDGGPEQVYSFSQQLEHFRQSYGQFGIRKKRTPVCTPVSEEPLD